MSPHGLRTYAEMCVPLPDEPLQAAARLAASGLHSRYMVYENNGEWAYAGGELAELTVDPRGTTLRHDGGQDTFLPWDGDPVGQVRQLLDAVEVPEWRAYGWAAFELSGLGRHIPAGDHLLHLVVPRAEARLHDHTAVLRAADESSLAALRDVVATPAPVSHREPAPLDVRRTGETSYRQAVKLAVDEINQGLLHKVILSRSVPVDEGIDLVATYLAGRRANTPARSFLLALGGIEAAGFSPEIVVRADQDGQVVSQPLAGTRARTGRTDSDRRLRGELLGSAKEVYEHAVSVKTGTEELLGVCDPDSVHVREYMTVRERGSVQHLASRVCGRLAEGRDCWDAFGAVFPAVTASGIPKSAAGEAIVRHEDEPRGLYSGAVLTVDHTGVLDAALVLRSVYRAAGRTWLRAGAGIVGQSEPEREFEETCEKLDSVARYLVPADTNGGGGR